MQKILHIITGGTILGQVPEYGEVGKLATIFTNTIDIEKYVKYSMKIDAAFDTKTVCEKDSRDVNDSDRKMIAFMIEQAYEEGTRLFLITHGTYTMPDTGVYLMNSLSEEILETSNIVLTASMYPTNFMGSDALLNIGASLSSLLNAENPLGVKVCMHGRNWDPRKIEKDAENLIFQEI